MLKTTALSTSIRLAFIRANKIKLDMDGGDSISGRKIDDKIANLSNSIMK